jgi:hypothetical protein
MTKTNTRPLNMDEKKKFESIVHKDIDNAKREFCNLQSDKKGKIQEELVKNPQGLKLLAKWVELHKQVKAVEKEAKKLGFGLTEGGYQDKTPRLTIDTYGRDIPKELIAIDDRTRKIEREMEEMKRTYTLKLFGGDTTEALEVFENLRKDLQALIK